ncbi:ATP-binding cassette domain-containing protein [Marinococcus sp. PL1-022]|uniref:ATP-binding cassette domain-containing protein n=1 Tax=Marinococcus sp. PL1-022 TaxID=3095363 RepID=UPI0029C31D6F|nr:ATP-binding cassette domain-containing protein [Marinococcus sp. PL1-022]MDX6153905.1 ATP-binding cassette domain-containing protein [Marinococcus sp. PL1-022]
MADNAEEQRPAVVVKGLVKTFGTTRAVDGIDLEMPAGTVCGVLGPNGAGKTTVLRILATLLKPSEGQASVFGHDVVEGAAFIRKRISMTGQFASVDKDLSGLENLHLIGRLMGFTRAQAKARAHELLYAFGLEESAKKQVKQYSGGMQRRLDIASSIVVTPDLLFLDEPTTGLDPRSRNQVWDIIRMLVDTGTTVLLTTQYLDEADQLADRIAVIDQGKVIAEGTSGELKASVGVGKLHVRLQDPGQRPLAARLLQQKLGTAVNYSSNATGLTAQVAENDLAVQILDELNKAGIAVSDFSVGKPSLDEVFLTLTGRSAEEEEMEAEA